MVVSPHHMGRSLNYFHAGDLDTTCQRYYQLHRLRRQGTHVDVLPLQFVARNMETDTEPFRVLAGHPVGRGPLQVPDLERSRGAFCAPHGKGVLVQFVEHAADPSRASRPGEQVLRWP